MNYWERSYWKDFFGGPKYWPWGKEGQYGAPSVDSGGLNYGDRLLDELETGIHTMHNNMYIRPHELSMHLEFALCQEMDHTGMSTWQKYMAPGWGYMGDVDGNVKNPKDIIYPVDLLHKPMSEHSYSPIGAVWTKEELELVEIFKKVRSGEIKPYINVDEMNLDPAIIEKFGGIKVAPNIKFFNNEAKTVDEFLNPKWEESWGNTNIYNKEFREIPTFENKDDWVPRGVVADKFAVSEINGEQELLSITTYTELKSPGDLLMEHRLYLDDHYHIDIDLTPGTVGIWGFKEFMDVLDPLTSSGNFICYLFNYIGVFSIMHCSWAIYYWYGVGLYGLRYGGWDERFRMRKYCGLDTRNTEAKRRETEYIDGIKEDALNEALLLNEQILLVKEGLWFSLNEIAHNINKLFESGDLVIGILY